jgi:hypothetical protein
VQGRADGTGWVSRAGGVGTRRMRARGGRGVGSVNLLDHWVQVIDLWSITLGDE